MVYDLKASASCLMGRNIHTQKGGQIWVGVSLCAARCGNCMASHCRSSDVVTDCSVSPCCALINRCCRSGGADVIPLPMVPLQSHGVLWDLERWKTFSSLPSLRISAIMWFQISFSAPMLLFLGTAVQRTVISQEGHIPGVLHSSNSLFDPKHKDNVWVSKVKVSERQRVLEGSKKREKSFHWVLGRFPPTSRYC